MNDNVLLSICIPTYNCYSLLVECLEVLFPQIKDYNVAVYVIDNASTDETYLIKDQFPSIVYIRNERNIGGDFNILKSYQIAAKKSEYICVLGDSYRFKGNFGRMLDILSKFEINLLVISRMGQSLNLDSCYYDNIDRVLSDLGGTMDLIGTIVIKKEAVAKSNYRYYMWSNFIHIGMAFNYLATLDNFKCYYLKELTLFHTRIDKTSTSWYKDTLNIFSKIWMLSILSLPANISLESKLECIKKHDLYTGTFSKRRLLYLRMIDGISLKIVNCYKAYLPFVTDTSLVYMYIICLLPKWIARFFLSLLNYIVKK